MFYRRSIDKVTRATLLLGLIGLGAAVGCDIPNVTFESPTGGGTTASATGGTGGAGTGGTGAGPTHTTSTGGTAGTGGGSGGTTASTTTSSTTSTTTTTTTSGGGPIVPCNYPTISDCEPGQVCCYDKSTMSPVDFCSSPGMCNPSSKYAEIQCNDSSDCPGQLCCAYVVLGDVENTYCAPACDDAQEVRACDDDGDCLTSIPYIACTEVLGYSAYKFCQLP
ncbi:MAG: hypothetical protein IPK82_14120 [Polyangiaceae bacterium]|nr:hypothetical protein [Polyangiaceae bacterium]